MPPPHMRGLPDDLNGSPKITKEIVLRIFSYLKPYKLEFFAVVIVIAVSSLLGVIPSVLTGKIVDDGLIGQNFDLLVKLVIYAFTVVIFSSMFNILEAYLNARISNGITYDMKNQLFYHLQKMEYGFFMNRRQGEIITRMTEDVAGVQSAISTTLTKALKNIGTVVITVFTLFSTNWILALFGVILIPIFIIPTKLTGKKRWKIARQIQSERDDSNQILNETLSVSGQLLAKLFNRGEDEYTHFEDINKNIYKLSIKEMLTGRMFFVTINIYNNFIPLVIYFIGGLMMLKIDTGMAVTVGDITVIVSLLSRLHHPLDELLNLQIDLTRSLALFERIFEYLDLIPDIKDKPDAKEVGRLKGSIEFDDVSFSYKVSEDPSPVLHNISFKMNPGQSFAFVGSSGAGKSTLITLLPRLYDVCGGKISIDGIDIRDMTQESLRKNIGMVSQDTYLFNGTILENLRYANSKATLEEIMEACKKANIHDFISSLPDGYDTLVGNRGLRLSGGEKQRLSIARVILKNPPIIILDEATSSLDSISESFIQSAIEPLLQDRTALVVAHRLSTIIASDKIAVIEDGTIVDMGTHTDLLKCSPLYQKFFETQFRIPETGGMQND